MDPVLPILSLLPFSILRPPRLRLKLPSTIPLPSSTTILSLLLLTYFAVISGLVYDVIVEPPGIGSTQDPSTGTVRPVVFMAGRVNGQYIIEGISSGFMFLLGGVGLILMDLALDKNRARSVRISFAAFGISAVVVGEEGIELLEAIFKNFSSIYLLAPDLKSTTIESVAVNHDPGLAKRSVKEMPIDRAVAYNMLDELLHNLSSGIA